MPKSPFKTCKVCNRHWESRDSFIAAEDIRLIGYQVNLLALEKGLFLFNHSCGDTLSVLAQEFTDLYNGPIYVESKHGSGECPGYCLHLNDLRPCPARCNCAYIREILNILEHKTRLTSCTS